MAATTRGEAFEATVARRVWARLLERSAHVGTWSVDSDANGKTVDDFVAPNYRRFDDVQSASGGPARAYWL